TAISSEAALPIDVRTWEKCVVDATEQKKRLLRELDSHVAGPIPDGFLIANKKNKNIPECRKDKITWGTEEVNPTNFALTAFLEVRPRRSLACFFTLRFA
ncbi:MAG TPA: hypothetical protein VEP28_05270, partial [Rubrobacter sp.]|nr:hypothetical protein [Rubrobacter sp.]